MMTLASRTPAQAAESPAEAELVSVPAASYEAVADEAPVSLRERKKLATRRSLRRIALDLVAERGLAQVTVEDIANAADVSPRTFFNYFPSKEAALFGTDPELSTVLRDRVAHDSPGAPVLDVLRSVIASIAQRAADELLALGGDPATWLRVITAARADPQVRAGQAAQMSMVERAITEGIAERLGTDPERDPYPGLLAALATGVSRSSLTFWANSGGTVRPDHLVDLAFRALADGLPEHCALRHVTESGAENVPHNVAEHATGNVADRKDNI